MLSYIHRCFAADPSHEKKDALSPEYLILINEAGLYAKPADREVT
jgi:hypothetical protein